MGQRRRLRDWSIPIFYDLTAVLIGFILPRLEFRFFPGFNASVSASVALTLYSSITSGMIALTAIVYSLAFLLTQFSAVAYSPRLVLWVSQDRVLWHSFGTFTATFLYAIEAMLWVDRNGSGRVPMLSGLLVIALMLASIGMFIALIQRVSMLQIGRMLAFTSDIGRQVIEQLYPTMETAVYPFEPTELASLPVTQTVMYVGTPRVLQAIHERTLLRLAVESGGAVVVSASVGDTLFDGTPLLRVFGGRKSVTDGIWRAAFETGRSRTFEQDPKYALRLLADIAIKALSPAVNDPTTAVQALDHIQDQLMRLGSRRLEIGAFRDVDGTLRLSIPHPTWDDFLALGLGEIRYYGGTSVQVMRRMSALITDLIAALPPERLPGLHHQRRRLAQLIALSFADDEGKTEAQVEDRQGLGASHRG